MEAYRKDKERQICKLKNEVKTLNEIEEIMNESGSSWIIFLVWKMQQRKYWQSCYRNLWKRNPRKSVNQCYR